jgi:hypothetical protein
VPKDFRIWLVNGQPLNNPLYNNQLVFNMPVPTTSDFSVNNHDEKGLPTPTTTTRQIPNHNPNKKQNPKHKQKTKLHTQNLQQQPNKEKIRLQGSSRN